MLLDPYQEPLTQLCRQYRINRLYLFGSGATGTFSEQSDIDLIVRFADQSLPPEDQGQRYWNFLAALEQLLGRPVDLLTDKQFSNPYFRQEVENTKIRVYDKFPFSYKFVI